MSWISKSPIRSKWYNPECRSGIHQGEIGVASSKVTFRLMSEKNLLTLILEILKLWMRLRDKTIRIGFLNRSDSKKKRHACWFSKKTGKSKKGWKRLDRNSKKKRGFCRNKLIRLKKKKLQESSKNWKERKSCKLWRKIERRRRKLRRLRKSINKPYSKSNRNLHQDRYRTCSITNPVKVNHCRLRLNSEKCLRSWLHWCAPQPGKSKYNNLLGPRPELKLCLTLSLSPCSDQRRESR